MPPLLAAASPPSAATIKAQDEENNRQRCVQMIAVAQEAARGRKQGYMPGHVLDALWKDMDGNKARWPKLTTRDMEAAVLATFGAKTADGAPFDVAEECFKEGGYLSVANVEKMLGEQPEEQFFAGQFGGTIIAVAAHPRNGVYVSLKNTSSATWSANIKDLTFNLVDKAIVNPCCVYDDVVVQLGRAVGGKVEAAPQGAAMYKITQTEAQLVTGAVFKMPRKIEFATFRGKRLCTLKTRAEFSDLAAANSLPTYCESYAEQGGAAAPAQPQAAPVIAGSPAAPRDEDAVQVTTLEPGTGCAPTPTSTVNVSYTLVLDDGSVVETVDAANSRLAGHQLRGWVSALQKMREGGSYEARIPAALAFGSRGALPRIPPNSPLTYKVKLNKVSGGAACQG
ncbi:FKBP-type peptidyl-prolyl cis-trans isomerase [Solimonas fluminis]|nr:FKBP-type peptidyl-prolyl cis-trans isomerase [Solimonas fluminis]